LARYTISASRRVIHGRRIRGLARLVDLPADGPGRLYVIEPDLTSTAELKAIVADYVEQAARWDAPPAEPLCPRDGITRPSSDDHTARRGKSPLAGDAQPA
jgi:hypothetical protein